jgi:hypothetical protein
MALTSNQKYSIKKKVKTLELKEIASDLNLPEKVVLEYLKKHLPNKKYEKIAKQKPGSVKKNLENNLFDFTLKTFILNHINYFVSFFVLIFIVYLNSLDNAFVSDDILGTQQNQALLDLSNLRYLASWGFLPHFFLAKLGLTAPAYFRAVNIIFHFGSTCLIFIILSMIGRKKIALFATIIFAIHPILTEAISWISARPYSEYGFFFLLSFLYYLLSTRSDKKNKRLLIISGMFFFIALVSSEKAVSLFAIFPLYELAFGNLKKKWKNFLPLFFITLIFIAIYLGGFGQRVSDLGTQYYSETQGIYNPLIQIPVATSSYLGLIFWPQGLTLYHTEMSFGTGIYLLYLLVFLFFCGLIFYGWKKNRFLFFWLSFFFISLTPTLTPLKISWMLCVYATPFGCDVKVISQAPAA